MSQLRRNVVANYLGHGWTAIVGLAFIPLYIQYLGMEAYGLIGLFAVIQAWLALFDVGMTPTLNREMARYTAGAHNVQSIHDLLRSLEVLCFVLAVLLGAGVWFASDYLANEWLKTEKLPTEAVAQALSAMAIVVGLRFVEGIYRGALLGLQRQVWYNGINATLATARYGGAALVLVWSSPTVQAFFLWQALVSLLSIFVLASGVQQILPSPPSRPRFSSHALLSVWKFARGMVGITLLALILTQVDKVLLSRLLTLESFGFYMLATTIASALYLAIGPIAQAIYPRMVALATQESLTALVLVYHQGAQLVTILTAPAAMLLSFFAGGVVFVWSGDANLAEKTAPILIPLVLGTFLNGLMWMPYQCQLAHGWTSLTLKVNLVAVAMLIPAIFWVVPRYGAVGAAWIWVALNAGYVLIAIQLMHQRLLTTEKWQWYLYDVTIPAGGSMGVIWLIQQLQPSSFQDRWYWAAYLMLAGVVSGVVSAALASRIRPELCAILRRAFRLQSRPARLAKKSRGRV